MHTTTSAMIPYSVPLSYSDMIRNLWHSKFLRLCSSEIWGIVPGFPPCFQCPVLWESAWYLSEINIPYVFNFHSVSKSSLQAVYMSRRHEFRQSRFLAIYHLCLLLSNFSNNRNSLFHFSIINCPRSICSRWKSAFCPQMTFLILCRTELLSHSVWTT